MLFIDLYRDLKLSLFFQALLLLLFSVAEYHKVPAVLAPSMHLRSLATVSLIISVMIEYWC